MPVYFFDFRASAAFAVDEENEDLTDLSAAHAAALSILAGAVKSLVSEGAADENLTVEVLDEFGPVLNVSAVLNSTILRKAVA